ncbi:PPA1309 family protein [Cellulomonas marina]|uniref:Uncharacterized protein n=1 Tax=Cellulomonas marina TaxID=988821 RepID=A0A1I1A2P7_9CELL|nr:PPA1309 family protein [Cellulomonas marina]GIG30466.1 hypothetical protein Cma02nite_30660 [Cellulomonas marina]SFB32147.1 hypothetical protein SAMN05421867_11478 [Cellulomonas marina]
MSTGSTRPATGPQDEEAARRALADAVREVEVHVARAGWDGPVRVFALVRTQAALASDPGLGPRLSMDVLAAAAENPWHLTSVEQERLPPADDLEGLLGALAWPPAVDGVALTVERLVVPPHVEEALPADPAAALEVLRTHPERTDVRMAVGVLRAGPSWCVLRTRSDDEDASVGQGPDAVPGLVEALRATLD